MISRVAIVGTGVEARQLAEEILRRHDRYDVACLVSLLDESGSIEFVLPNPGRRAVPLIRSATLHEFARAQRVGRIVIATGDGVGALPAEQLQWCKRDGCVIEPVEAFYERLLRRIPTAGLSPDRLIRSAPAGRSRFVRAIKRMTDVLTALGVLVLTAPLSLLVALLIKLEDGGPVLFRQVRVGRHGKTFTLRKFRSMRVDAEAETGPVWARTDDPRVTWVGRWTRPSRIDEIPQAWNVLRGDMSFVGPRPERPEFVTTLRSLIPFYEQRQLVRPGITGWAQVNQPYAGTVDDARQKLEYDLYYLKHFSLLGDLAIMVRTAKIILFGWGSRWRAGR
jgi:exopolysaccharide biosynthesis polyprenyl glycosylphosphotransferase